MLNKELISCITTCLSSMRLRVFLEAHVDTRGGGIVGGAGKLSSWLLSRYLRHISFILLITVCINFKGSYTAKQTTKRY